MLIEKLDVAIIDPSSDFLADLVWSSPLNHVETRPSIFGFSAGGGANEEVVFEFSLQIVFFNVIS